MRTLTEGTVESNVTSEINAELEPIVHPVLAFLFGKFGNRKGRSLGGVIHSGVFFMGQGRLPNGGDSTGLGDKGTGGHGSMVGPGFLGTGTDVVVQSNAVGNKLVGGCPFLELDSH